LKKQTINKGITAVQPVLTEIRKKYGIANKKVVQNGTKLRLAEDL